MSSTASQPKEAVANVLPDQGHRGVWAVAFSPDGRLLAVGYDDGTIGLWHPGDGGLQRTLKGHQKYVTDLAFASHGKTLVSSSEDGTAIVWEVATGKQKAVLKGHQDPVYSVAFASDGKTLATGGADNAVRLWDAVTWRLKRLLRGNAGPEAREQPPSVLQVADVAFSPDGRWLAIVHRVTYPGEPMRSADYISVRSTHTGKVKHSLSYRNQVIDRVQSIAFSPDSKSLIAGHDRSGAGGHLERWEIATGEHQTLARDVEPGIAWIAFALDGEAIVVAGLGRDASLWNAQTGKQMATFQLSHAAGSLAVAPNGTIAAIGESSGQVTLWRLPQPQ